MTNLQSETSFSAQIERIKLITGRRTQAELADFFGVSRSAAYGARRRGKIPSGWLITLMQVNHVQPLWVLTGIGPRYMASPASPDCFDTSSERTAYEAMLKLLPARMLADELIRRIEAGGPKLPA